MRHVVTGTIDFAGEGGKWPFMVPKERHVEFDDADGGVVAQAFLDTFGDKRSAFDECLMMLIVASGRQDTSTINGCLCARRYMRTHRWDESES